MVLLLSLSVLGSKLSILVRPALKFAAARMWHAALPVRFILVMITHTGYDGFCAAPGMQGTRLGYEMS